jgi:hypothetical protein
MSGWRVDPDRVIGVLADIDDDGADLAQAGTDVQNLAWEGGAGLKADGRTTVANAWTAFLEDRSLVPGKLTHVLSSAAAAVTEATVSVVSGDEEMAGNGRDAEALALERWGIEPPAAYQSGPF